MIIEHPLSKNLITSNTLNVVATAFKIDFFKSYLNQKKKNLTNKGKIITNKLNSK